MTYRDSRRILQRNVLMHSPYTIACTLTIYPRVENLSHSGTYNCEECNFRGGRQNIWITMQKMVIILFYYKLSYGPLLCICWDHSTCKYRPRSAPNTRSLFFIYPSPVSLSEWPDVTSVSTSKMVKTRQFVSENTAVNSQNVHIAPWSLEYSS